MSTSKALNRRRLIKIGLLGGAGAVAVAALAGCGETQIVEKEVIKIVTQEVAVEKIVTQIVEKEKAVEKIVEKIVTQIVEKEKIVEKIVTAEVAKPLLKSGSIEYWSWWSPSLRIWFGAWDNWLREEFMKRNPNVKVDVKFFPFGELITKITASLAGGDAPDASHNSVAFARDLFDKGALLPLNDMIKRYPENSLENYFPVSVFFNQYKGQVFGMPGEGPEFNNRAYRVDDFVEVGLDPDSLKVQEWDAAMWVEAAKKLTKREGDKIIRSGWIANNVGLEQFAGNTYSNGVPNLYIDEGKALHPDVAVKGAEILQYEYDMLNVHKVSAPITPDRTSVPDFYAGKASCIYTGSGNIGEFHLRQPDMKFEMVQMPKYPGFKKERGVTWTNMMTVPKKGKDNELGFEFARWYAGAEAAVARVQIGGIPSAHKSFYETSAWDFLKSTYKEWQHFFEDIKPMDSAGPWPYIRQAGLSQILGPLGEAVNLGKKTPAEAMDEFVKGSVEVLADVP